MSQTDHDRPADRLVSLLARRIEVLEQLLDAELTRPELVEELDISRSTVDRAVRELEEMGLVEVSDGAYRASLPGRLAHAEYAELRSELVMVEEVADLLRVLPPDAPVPLAALQDAEVVTASDIAPHVPGSRITDLIKGADHVSSLSVALTTPATGEAIEEGVRAGELTVEAVFERRLYDYLADEEALAVEDLQDTDRFDAWVTEGLPFGLVLVESGGDRRMCIAVYDGDRTLRGAVINDTTSAISWAESLFETYRDAATAPD